MVVEFSVREIPGTGEEYVLVEFQLERPLKPEDLKTIKPPEVPHGRVVLLSGRGPIWLYAVLLHEYLHKAKAVAVYDPKIPGYVVVATHTTEHSVGDVITAG